MQNFETFCQIQHFMSGKRGIKDVSDMNFNARPEYISFLLIYLTNFLDKRPISFRKFNILFKKVLYNSVNIDYKITLENPSTYFKLLQCGLVDFDGSKFFYHINKLCLVNVDVSADIKFILSCFKLNYKSKGFYTLLDAFNENESDIISSFYGRVENGIYLPDIYPYLNILELRNRWYVPINVFHAFYENKRFFSYDSVDDSFGVFCHYILDDKNFCSSNNKKDMCYDAFIVAYTQSYKIINKDVYNYLYEYYIYSMINLNFSLLDIVKNIDISDVDFSRKMLNVLSNSKVLRGKEPFSISYPFFLLNEENKTTLKDIFKSCHKNQMMLFFNVFMMFTSNVVSYKKTLEIENKVSNNVFQISDKTIVSIPNDFFYFFNEVLDMFDSVSLCEAFANCFNLKNLRFPQLFSTSKVVDTSGMFKRCSNVSYIDLSLFDSSNVTDMSHMFNGCSNLSVINLVSCKTSNVTDMNHMFNGCAAICTLSLSSFDTFCVTDMSYMFCDCVKLHSIEFPNSFSTASVRNMSSMFSRCLNLGMINLSSFITSNAQNMEYMFSDCSKLTVLDLSSFNTSNVTNMSYMFNNCSHLTSINVSQFDTSKVLDMRCMFNGCSSIPSLNLETFITRNVKDMSNMFSYCSNLSNISLSSFDTKNVKSMKSMFESCTSLSSLDISSFRLNNASDLSCMFKLCTKLSYLDISKFEVNDNIDTTQVFESCSRLKTIKHSSTNQTVFNESIVQFMDGKRSCLVI